MCSNEKVINYKVVDLVEIYNFGFGRFIHLGSFVQFKKIEFQNLSASNIILNRKWFQMKKSSTTKLSIASRSTTLM